MTNTTQLLPNQEGEGQKESKEDTMNLSKGQMACKFTKLAVPSVITNFFNYLVLTVNTIFAGQLEHDSTPKLAAVGIGSMILGMLCRNILVGVNAAQETLVA